jgi:hypothetical protein
MLTSWAYASVSGTFADASAERGKLIPGYTGLPDGLHCQGEPPVVAAAIGKFSCVEVAGQPLRDLYTARSAGTGSPISRDQDSRHREIFYAGLGRDLTS